MPNGTRLFSIELAGSTAPEWVQLLPTGKFSSHEFDRRAPWVMTDAAAVVRKSLSLGRDPVIDFEHQTDRASKNGQPAPAAGWIKELASRKDGIWARVKWTPRAKKMIEDGEYRYLSPVFAHSNGREVTAILRAALTNDPALSLVALAKTEDGDIMPEFLKKLAAALGMSEDKASEEEICTAVQDLRTAAASAVNGIGTIAEAAGLAKDAKLEDITTAIAAAKSEGDQSGDGKPDPAKFVPYDQFQKMAADFSDLQKRLTTDAATAAVDAAVKEGKVTPGTRPWAIDYASSNPQGFAEFIAKAPVLSGGERLGGPPDKGTGLTAQELEVCKATGVTPEDFKKTKEEGVDA